MLLYLIEIVPVVGVSFCIGILQFRIRSRADVRLVGEPTGVRVNLQDLNRHRYLHGLAFYIRDQKLESSI
jgi:hypothetical protein